MQVNRDSVEHEPSVRARMVLNPAVRAAPTVSAYGEVFGEHALEYLVDALSDQTNAVIDGDLRRGEAMLTVQAHTLDAIYNDLARRAIRVEHISQLEAYLKLALRAQSQCRATWEAVSAIQNPPVAGYVNQANIAYGPQQVNNETDTRAHARTRENENPPNKLLEDKEHEPDQWMDRGAPATASAADSEIEAVGKVDGSENT